MTTPLLSPSKFYDALAAGYDRMTDPEKRFIREKPFVRVLVDKYKIRRALDAGAGTGFHSLLLGRLGVEVTAVDLSGEMLSRLKGRANAEEIDIRTVQLSFEQLDPLSLGTFNAVFCMGNTLAHLLTHEEIVASLTAFRRLLAPAGILFLQILNYDRILLQRPGILAVTDTGTATFVRSYEYNGDTIIFSIASTQKDNGGAEQQVRTTLRPLRRADLVGLLGEAGFSTMHTFGGISMEPFSDEQSRDLVVLAQQ